MTGTVDVQLAIAILGLWALAFSVVVWVSQRTGVFDRRPQFEGRSGQLPLRRTTRASGATGIHRPDGHGPPSGVLERQDLDRAAVWQAHARMPTR